MTNSLPKSPIIIVGGGLAGVSAAHTVLERGGNVVLLDKSAFLGGNSTKATSGINGAGTRTQRMLKEDDTVELFLEDTVKSSKMGKEYPLARVLCEESGPAVEWLQDSFDLRLDLLGQLGGHSVRRTHRSSGRPDEPQKFPGMEITMRLINRLEDVCEKTPERAAVLTKATVTELIKEGNAVTGVKYTHQGKNFDVRGPVILCTGGYGADFGDDSILMKFRPDLKPFATTNGPHCTGDGVKMTESIGGGLKDMTYVQVHPTGLINPKDPNSKTKWLAAGALRGAGAVIFDADGKRFCDELGTRDYVSGEMLKGKGPFRLILSKGSHEEMDWHCHHYASRGLMTKLDNWTQLAKEMNVDPSVIKKTVSEYNSYAKNNNDPWGKKHFRHTPINVNESLYVAQITPVVHYSMGGIFCNERSEVLTPDEKPIPGLYCAGEVMGGTHGKNRLGGSSLLDCVVYGRVSAASATTYLLQQHIQNPSSSSKGVSVTINFQPNSQNVNVGVNWNGSSAPSTPAPQNQTQQPKQSEGKPATETSKPVSKQPSVKLTRAEVAKHNSKDDCWVIVNGQVLNATSFLDDHPGGSDAIMLYAGKEATDEFNMLHDKDVVEKYAPEIIVGPLEDEPKAKL